MISQLATYQQNAEVKLSLQCANQRRRHLPPAFAGCHTDLLEKVDARTQKVLEIRKSKGYQNTSIQRPKS